MSEDHYLQLVKDQNRAISTLRRMMQSGLFVVFLPDRNLFNMPLQTGQWALCKHPMPQDKAGGVVLFPSYDDAYDAGRFIAWKDRRLDQYGPVQPLERLDSLVRKILTDDR